MGCQKPCWDQAKLSSLVNKQVVLQSEQHPCDRIPPVAPSSASGSPVAGSVSLRHRPPQSSDMLVAPALLLLSLPPGQLQCSSVGYFPHPADCSQVQGLQHLQSAVLASSSGAQTPGRLASPPHTSSTVPVGQSGTQSWEDATTLR